MAKKPDLSFLASILKETGVKEDATEGTLELNELRQEQERIQARRDRSLINQNGLIFALHHPHSMTVRACKRCGKKFYTSHCREAICSDICRKADFLEHFGVPWDAIDTTTEYVYEKHALLDSEQTYRLLTLATTILRDESEVMAEILEDQQGLPEELGRLLDRIEQARAAFESERTTAGIPEPEIQLVSDVAEENQKATKSEVPSFDFHLDELTFDLPL